MSKEDDELVDRLNCSFEKNSAVYRMIIRPMLELAGAKVIEARSTWNPFKRIRLLAFASGVICAADLFARLDQIKDSESMRKRRPDFEAMLREKHRTPPNTIDCPDCNETLYRDGLRSYSCSKCCMVWHWNYLKEPEDQKIKECKHRWYYYFPKGKTPNKCLCIICNQQFEHPHPGKDENGNPDEMSRSIITQLDEFRAEVPGYYNAGSPQKPVWRRMDATD